ncbi:WD repeat protein [Aureobasidium pullulans]|uniref:Serine-threonine kinase receptor-associated protein n=1 Tax=Aureobasidium pullulans TaxID=5580 RepID=A0A4S8SFJ8_AURPU|nr:WD repeat protein [Aureobasidium pullulans]THW66435.1 WD repeat protein [Aureobasidium pullulans]THW70307.1 WD repeat protein [Aureobasidium pullulans]THW91334.1 WD repeat protein [Aureobasidium pullulans]THY08042.1 WD repeat protein [Aureobasidium pullulans]
MATETSKVVPLTCHGHSRPITHISFSALSPASASSSQPQYYLISACKDNNPMLRDGLTGDWIGTFVGHKGAVWSARVSADGSLAATGSADFSAKVWDTFTGEQLHTLQHNHIVRAVAFPALQDRPTSLATGGMEKKLRIWDLTRVGVSNGASSVDECYEVGAGEHGQTIKSIVWSAANPNILTTACDDKKLRWWDLRSRSAIATHEVEGTIGSCELNSSILDGSANGTLSVAAGKSVYFFDGARPGVLLDSKTLDQEIASVAVCGSQRRFVTGSARDTFVRVWDLDSGAEIETRKGHHGPVWTSAFSPDGKLYATGSEDGTIKLWKATTESYGLWK